MTTHFIDITLRPDPEFSRTHLLGALIAKLHRALVQLDAEDIGISFPQYSLLPRSLGDVLRLHSDEAGLQRLMALSWLQGMRDHVKLSDAEAVPSTAVHGVVQRRQFKTNADRLRRRRMQRKGETMEQASAAIPDSVERRPDLPYLHVRSASTGQPFCLFIDQRVGTGELVAGRFNCYGLSLGGTVPCF
jgi:CRISPR-associated endonuclease Csy4